VGLLELLGLAYREFIINLKSSFMHRGCQLFSPTLLVEMDKRLLIIWVALYALASVWRRGERGKHTRALAHLARPGVVWRGDGRRRMTCV
jgi:hypothetical protein